MHSVEIQRILTDPGSAVNLLPYRTLRRVNMTTEDFEHEDVTIFGFNQSESETIPRGSITLPVRRRRAWEKGFIRCNWRRHLLSRFTWETVISTRSCPPLSISASNIMRTAKIKESMGTLHPFSVLETRYTDADVRALKISRNGLRIKKELRWRTRFRSVKSSIARREMTVMMIRSSHSQMRWNFP